MEFLALAAVALLVVLIVKAAVGMAGPGGDRFGSSYGLLDKHAPQVVGFLLGLVLAIAARIGLVLTEAEVATLTTFLTFIVPIGLSWLAGKITERFTYSKETVDRRLQGR